MGRLLARQPCCVTIELLTHVDRLPDAPVARGGFHDRALQTMTWTRVLESLARVTMRLVPAGALVVAALLLPADYAAQAPVSSAALVPGGPTRFVELSAFTIDADLECTPDGCSLLVTQGYRFANLDRIKQAELILSLMNTGGEALSPDVRFAQAADSVDATTWSLRLEPSATASATLSYQIPLDGPMLLHWAWDPAAIAAWGTPGSTRITLMLPNALLDDAFVARQPAVYSFDGHSLEWSYEATLPAEPHAIWMLAPNVWARLQELEREGPASEHAALLMALRSEAVERRAPLADLYPRALGVLLEELDRTHSTDTYLALADLYMSRAEEMVEDNYRLLAAETLQSAVDSGHGNSQVLSRLAEIYGVLAEIAHKAGDSSRALEYLEAAAAHSQTAQVDSATRELLTLSRAVELAARGQVSDSLVQMGAALSPRVQDALYRYAPPLRSARTEITLEAGSRTATYYLLLYPPVQEASRAALDALAMQVRSLQGFDAALQDVQGQPYEVVLHITATFEEIEQERERRRAIYALAGQEPSFIAAFIVAPWAPTDLALTVIRNPFFDHYIYQEEPDLSLVSSVRDEQLQYTVWRLLEVAGTTPSDESARLEQQLTGLALREERQVWEALSASTYWTYRVAFPAPSPLDPLTWLVGWGQERPLAISHRTFHWEAILQALLIMVGVFLILGALASLWRHSRRRRR